MNHLPECRARYVDDLCTTDIDPVLQEPSCNHCVGQGCICICDRLRACEQRVLDAAREAVAGLKRHVEFPGAPVNYIHPDFFLAAIDALRQKP